MNKKDKPHVGIESPSGFPKELLNSEIAYLQTLGCEVQLRENEMFGKPMAMGFLAFGTACVVYLLKPYFEAFLQETSKEHYGLFKKWFNKHVINRRKIKVTTITASQSLHKLTSASDQSQSISIKAIIGSELSITVLINNEIDDEALNVALDQLNDELLRISKEILCDKSEPEGRLSIYLLFNVEKSQWEVQTREQLIEKYGG